jgi:hypothetical protein
MKEGVFLRIHAAYEEEKQQQHVITIAIIRPCKQKGGWGSVQNNVGLAAQ